MEGNADISEQQQLLQQPQQQHGHAFRPVMSPLARAQSNTSLGPVVSPTKLASLIAGRRGSATDLGRSDNPRRGSAVGSYGIPVPPDAQRFGGSSHFRPDMIDDSRTNSFSGGRNSPTHLPAHVWAAGNNNIRNGYDRGEEPGTRQHHGKKTPEAEKSRVPPFTALYSEKETTQDPGPSRIKTVLLKIFTFGFSGDAEGAGCCAILIALFSALIVFATLPLSLFFTVKVVKEYERAVIFRLGRLKKGGAKGPGIFFVIPCVDSYNKVDLRTVSFDVPPQEILSRDSVTVSVDAVVYYRVSNPTMATNNVEDYRHSTHLLAATTLRNVLGTKCLAQILSEREQISHHMETTLDEATDPWGVKVERVEIKDVRLPVQLQRAMAAEAEAAREARAKVITAEGEKTASQALKSASEIICGSPAAMQLRYLQTLNSISAEKNSTIIFPVPIDLFSHFNRRKID